MRISTGEVGARRSVVRHKKRITDKGGIADHECHASGRMPRRMHYPDLKPPDAEHFAVDKLVVELGTVARKRSALVEDLSEDDLDLANMFPDADPSAQPLLEIWRRREVICMCVGLELSLIHI